MSQFLPLIDEPADLSPEWLENVLQSQGVMASVRQVAVTPLGSGQMAACYRVAVDYQSGQGPTHVVAKLPSPDPETRAAGAMTYRAEVGFYRELATRIPGIVPHCYFADIHEDGTMFTLILQDLAPAEAGDQLTGCTAEDAYAAVDAVTQLHAASWCDESIRDLDWLVPTTSALAELVQPVLGSAVESFVGRRDLDGDTIRVLRGFEETFTAWASHSPAAWSLLHNDFRLDNLMFATQGAALAPVTVLDWQSLSVGPPVQDIAFLLGTSLAPDVRREHERDILSEYRNRLQSLGVFDYEPDACWNDYRRGLFQGVYVCLLGDMIADQNERGLGMFTAMATRAAAAICELQAFDVL